MTNSLSDRELKILIGLSHLTALEVANRLNLSRPTIFRCAAAAYAKLGGRSDPESGFTTRQLIVRSMAAGLLTGDERLSPSGGIVRTPRGATRKSLGLP